jgi:glycosyltransferase involved in cell wall biosynthesis
MNICMVSRSYWEQAQGGAEYQLLEIANTLIASGHKVSYIFINNKKQHFEDQDIHLLPISQPVKWKRILGPDSITVCFRLNDALRDLEPDIILNRRGDALTGICAWYANRHKCRFVWHIASLMDTERYRYKWSPSTFFEWLDKRILAYGIKHAHTIIGQTNMQSRQLQLNFKRSCDAVIPNAHPVPKDRFRKTKPPTVAWIANIKPLKRPELFVRLAQACPDLPARFVMVGKEGNPKYNTRLMALVGATPNLDYLGQLPLVEVNKLLEKASVLVSTSLPVEGFPNTFIQAWMRRVPTISLAFDVDKTIQREAVGFCPADFDELIGNVKELVLNEDLRNTMGAHARNYAVSNLDMAVVLPRYVALIEGLTATDSNT